MTAVFAWLRRLLEPPRRAAPVAAVAAAAPRPAALPASTPELIAVLLEGRDEAQRVKAARALGERLPLDRHLIVPALVKATQESSPAVRRAAREPMSHGRVGAALLGVIEALREGLDEPEASDRHAVIAALGSQTGYSPQFYADMLKCLRDEDAGVRSSAAYYVADFLRRGSAPTDDVWAALADPSSNVRRYVVRGLGRTRPGDERVNAVLLELLRDESAAPYQLDDAVELVGLLPEPAAAAVLDRCALPAAHPNRVRLAVIRTRFPGLAARGLEELMELLQGTERQRIDAVRAAPKVRPHLDAAVLRSAAPGEPALVRAAALEAARDLQLPADERLRLVRENVDAPERERRWASYALLGTLSHERAAEVLELCTARLGGPEGDELARVLGWLGARAAPAVPQLVRSLEQRPSTTVLYALGSIGPPAHEALRVVARLARSATEAYVRSTAVETLGRIGLAKAGDTELELVIALAGEGEPGARDAAVSALETVAPGPPRVRDALMQSVVREEGLSDARRRRVLRLAEWGPEVTPALVRALEDRDEQVAADALRALQRLGAAAVPHLERMRGDPSCADAPRAEFVLQQLGERR